MSVGLFVVGMAYIEQKNIFLPIIKGRFYFLQTFLTHMGINLGSFPAFMAKKFPDKSRIGSRLQ